MVNPKPFQVDWDRNALDDLKEILEYLSAQSSQASKIVKSAILSRIDVVKTNPFICEKDELRLPINEEFRAFVVFSYRITYHVHVKLKQVRILRIRHTSREPLLY